MKIRNKNFICNKMTKRDIVEAFCCERKQFIDDICDLISDGWITKIGDRFFHPTQKLLNIVFLPECGYIILSESQRRALSYHTTFYYGELISLFEDNEVLINAMIKCNYLKLHEDKRYRKSKELEEFLIDGGDKLNINENQFFKKKN